MNYGESKKDRIKFNFQWITVGPPQPSFIAVHSDKVTRAIILKFWNALNLISRMARWSMELLSQTIDKLLQSSISSKQVCIGSFRYKQAVTIPIICPPGRGRVGGAG